MTAATQAQIESATAITVNALKTGSTIAAQVDPSLLPAVVAGQALLSVVPGLEAEIIALLNQGNTPITPAQNSAIVQTIVSLQNPGAL